MNNRNVQVGKAIDLCCGGGWNFSNSIRDNHKAYKDILTIDKGMEKLCKMNIVKKIAPHKYKLTLGGIN